MGKSKIIYGGTVLIDLTADTIADGKVLLGYKFHGPDGEIQAPARLISTPRAQRSRRRKSSSERRQARAAR